MRNKKKNQVKKQYKPRPAPTTADFTAEKKEVEIPAVITVKALSDITGIPVVNLISSLMKSGILAAINESIDFETAAIVCDDFGVTCNLPTQADESKSTQLSGTDHDKHLMPRPPVVTVMGHVDHGKTSLLDKVRQASVASSESGGITQHISAYQVEIDEKDKKLKNKRITFIDTPGHAAFSALRGHGAAITDIVVLIIAADDGVMPQTVEVIEQCKKHRVPIIVAINKVDLPDADPMKIKQQLSEYELLAEEWGGKTVMVEISAKTGQGVDNLLEVILLQAEMMELKADYEERAFGVVIESHMQKGAGPLALVLIENGTLRKGDIVQIGNTWGRVRIMEDYNLKPVDEAGPSMPVRIAGLRDLPEFGDHLIVYGSEKEAKEASSRVSSADKVQIATAKKMQEEEAKDDRELEYRIIVKADVKGSLDAIKKLIEEIDTLELKVKIVGQGIGAVAESDVTLAKAANSIVYAFRVPVLISAKKISDQDKVGVKSFDIIYELIDEIKRDLTAKLPPLFNKEVLGQGEVLAVFRDDKKAFVAGGKLSDGKASKGDLIRFYSDGEVVSEGKILSLRREKSEVDEISSGVEFGFSLEPGVGAKVGQKLEVYKIVEVSRSIK